MTKQTSSGRAVRPPDFPGKKLVKQIFFFPVHRFYGGKLQLKDAIGETETRIDPFICTDGKWASFAGVIE